jgi:hypothetical protein
MSTLEPRARVSGGSMKRGRSGLTGSIQGAWGAAVGLARHRLLTASIPIG